MLRRDAIRWLREHRTQLYVEMLMQARAQQFYLGFATSSDTAREQMREVFAETDTRLPPQERARLGANGSVFASAQVRGLCEQLFAESWPVSVNPARFRSDEARLEVLGTDRGHLGRLGGGDRPPASFCAERICPGDLHPRRT